ncbi:hypothetical protein I6A84_07535 [Frankia sp. CNm7]|nr:hypothetical protein [Frankia nepalensis]
MVFTVVGAVREHQRGSTERGGSATPGRARLPDATPSHSPPAGGQIPAWPWVGTWEAEPDSPLPGFGLDVVDAGPSLGGERFTATETSPACPVRYRGTAFAPPDRANGPSPPGPSEQLVLDAYIPAGQDPGGCTLLPAPSYYWLAGAELTRSGAIRIQLVDADGTLARASVTVRPGETRTILLRRV